MAESPIAYPTEFADRRSDWHAPSIERVPLSQTAATSGSFNDGTGPSTSQFNPN